MLTDEELIELVQQQDETAENQLFERYKDLVTKISRGYFIVGGDIEDLIQEGMIGLYRAIKGFKQGKDATFKTFAVICIKHQIHAAIKKSLAKKNLPLSTAVSFQTFDKDKESEEYLPLELVLDITPAEHAIDKENLVALKQNIKECLSNFEIKVLKLYLQGFSYIEIANKLEIAKKSIDNALLRIRTKLREKLKVE